MIHSIIVDAVDEFDLETGFNSEEFKKHMYNKFMPVGSLEDIDFTGLNSIELAEKVNERAIQLYTIKEENIGKKHMYNKFMPVGSLEDIDFTGLNSIELAEKVNERAIQLYTIKEENIGSDRMREVERIVLLQSVDNHWIDHIDAMDQLRQGIGLRALGQQDPVIAYKMEGFDMFDDMNKLIREDTVKFLFNITVEVPAERKAVVDVDKLESPDTEGTGKMFDDMNKLIREDTVKFLFNITVEVPAERKAVVDVDKLESPDTEGTGKKPVVADKKVGRNDPCPCGSGKKYKNCCGR